MTKLTSRRVNIRQKFRDVRQIEHSQTGTSLHFSVGRNRCKISNRCREKETSLDEFAIHVFESYSYSHCGLILSNHCMGASTQSLCTRYWPAVFVGLLYPILPCNLSYNFEMCGTFHIFQSEKSADPFNISKVPLPLSACNLWRRKCIIAE